MLIRSASPWGKKDKNNLDRAYRTFFSSLLLLLLLSTGISVSLKTTGPEHLILFQYGHGNIQG